MRKTPYTTAELFDTINSELKKKNLLPDILYYGVADIRKCQIRSYEWDLIGIIRHDGNEGISLSLYCYGDTGNGMQETPVGTYKTLRKDKDAFKALSELNTEFVFAVRDLVQKNMNDFTWQGYNVYEQETDEGRIIPRYEVPEWKRALARASQMASDKHHPVSRILLRDNSTRAVTAYDVKDGCLVPRGRINLQIA